MRIAVRWLAAVAALLLAAPAAAQQYPDRTLRMIVPFAAGGGTDILARAIADKLSERWGKPVIVDNRPGASTQIGADLVAKAAPDGYTILLTANPHTVNPSLYATLPYDTRKDFAPITLVASAPLILVVHPGLGIDSVATLVAHAKAKPGTLNYATSGTAGPQHMAGELFKHMAGVEMTHIPYRGSGPATTELLGGQVQLSFASLLTVLPHVNAGKLKALGVTAAKRMPARPDLPTVAEAGNLPGYALTTWYGLLGTAGTPPAILDKLQGAVAEILHSPEIRERLARDGSEPGGNSRQAFAAFLDAEIETFARLVKAANIKPE